MPVTRGFIRSVNINGEVANAIEVYYSNSIRFQSFCGCCRAGYCTFDLVFVLRQEVDKVVCRTSGTDPDECRIWWSADGDAGRDDARAECPTASAAAVLHHGPATGC